MELLIQVQILCKAVSFPLLNSYVTMKSFTPLKTDMEKIGTDTWLTCWDKKMVVFFKSINMKHKWDPIKFHDSMKD